MSSPFQSTECPICLESFEHEVTENNSSSISSVTSGAGESNLELGPVVHGTCGHHFHQKCIQFWFQRTPTRKCPYPNCDTNLNDNDLHLGFMETLPVGPSILANEAGDTGSTVDGQTKDSSGPSPSKKLRLEATFSPSTEPKPTGNGPPTPEEPTETGCTYNCLRNGECQASSLTSADTESSSALISRPASDFCESNGFSSITVAGRLSMPKSSTFQPLKKRRRELRVIIHEVSLPSRLLVLRPNEEGGGSDDEDAEAEDADNDDDGDGNDEAEEEEEETEEYEPVDDTDDDY